MKIILEHLFQTLAQHHNAYPQFIRQHCSKVCEISIGPWSTTLQLHHSGIVFIDIPTDNKIQIHSPTHIEFEGDIVMCQALAQLLSSKHIDLEGLLFSTLPDSIAMLSLEGLDTLKSTLKHTRSQMHIFLKDYLTHQTGICATKQECNQLYEDTLKLKWAVEEHSSIIEKL